MGPCNDDHRQSIAIRYSKMINGLLSAHYYTKNSKVLLSVLACFTESTRTMHRILKKFHKTFIVTVSLHISRHAICYIFCIFVQ